MSDITLTQSPETSGRNKISEARKFLSDNYDIRINILDPTRPVIRSKVKEYQHDVEFNDIYLHCKDEDLSISSSDLRMLITSRNQMETFNPIEEYFINLKDSYKGISHIDMLIDHLTITDFGDKREINDKFYTNRARNLFRKWIVATAACAMQIKQNDVALGLIAAAEGIGKTFLTEFITPKSLIEYYLCSSPKDDKFDLETEFSRNLIVNFDELVGVGSGNAEEFKKALSAKSFQFRTRGFATRSPRIASATFTTNRNQEMGGFLTPNMGYRRFGCIEVSAINRDYSSKVDVDQIWAEAVMLINSTQFDYNFTMDDFKDFEEYNSRYIKQDNAHSLIAEWFEIPSSESEGIFMQPIDIIKELNGARKIKSNMPNITEVSIGQALKAHGFRKVSKRTEKGPRNGYLVKKTF